MKIGKVMKIAPLVLAFMLIIPVGAMAQTYQYGDQNNNDYSTLSGSSATWNHAISQDLTNTYGTIADGSTFKWYNEFHNANGNVVQPVLYATSAGVDNFPLGNLGPYSYTSNFLYQTTNCKAQSGYNAINVQHTYNGPFAQNTQQTYTGA